MPAAAVIPAPIAYIKVAAVKKLVVGFVARPSGGALFWEPFVWFSAAPFFVKASAGIRLSVRLLRSFTVKKLECYACCMLSMSLYHMYAV